MTVQIVVDNVVVPYSNVSFSDGGTNIKLKVPEKLTGNPPKAYYSIVVETSTPVDNYLWEILQTVDAVEQTFGKVFNRKYLYLPYLPHGRADRVFEHGNGFPLQLFLETVSWMFDGIFLTDPHSDFYKKYDNNLVNGKRACFEVKTQHQCFIEVAGREIQSGDVLIAPDEGSLSKIYKLQQALDNRTIATFIVEAGKKRDVETGRVVETTLPDEVNLKGKVCWIVDDICDAGGTFIPLAKLLKERGAHKVNLYVTHFIGAKGLDLFKGVIDNIYTYQTVGNYINRINIDNFNKGVV
jgi:ribose-phosphate pyrophosphokinase